MAASKWATFLRQCFRSRTSGEEFADLLPLLYERKKIPGLAIVQLILKCKTDFCAPNDPLVQIYLQQVLSLALADVSDLLTVLIHGWNEFAKTEEENQYDSDLIEETTSLVNGFLNLIANNSFTISTAEARRSLILCSRWLTAIAGWVSRDSSRATDLRAMAFVEACGTLLIALASSTVGIALLDECRSADAADDIEPVASIQKAILFSLPLLPTASQSLHLRLEAVLRHVSQPRTNEANEASPQDVLNFRSNVIDGPSLASRASLYLYLDSLRCRCATINDSRLLSFLNARHSTDHATMFTDLVVASFDVLQRSHSRERNRQSLDRWCSFIVNKLPTLLSVISGSSFGSFSTEDALKTGLQYVHADFASSYLSTGILVVKTKFVQVCASYRLLPTSNVPMVLGTPEVDIGLSPTLHAKDDLVVQMKSSQPKAAKLLTDLKALDGNAANIASAVFDVVHTYCQSKETLPLKEFAIKMLRTPELIDIISIYIQPEDFLAPLCQLLDDWNWDDLHGEGQPLYEEFGSIMLLISAFTHRLSMTESNFVVSKDSSFVSSFLQNANDELYLESMANDTKRHLGEWINALFIAEGLSDEVMSSCSPQDFYRLVPTLLSQSLTACENAKMGIETLKAGFEYLLETFLLPSLIPAVSWLRSPAASRHSQVHVQRLLETLLKEPSSGEARDVHRAILGILASEAGVLTSINNQIGSEVLSKHVGFVSTVSSDIQEVKTWSAMPGGLMAQAEQALHALISWASANTMLMGPPRSACTLLADVLEIYDARTTLKRLSKVLLSYYNTIDHSSALDLVATVIVCVDEITPTKRLADALVLEQQNLLTLLQKNESLLAEEIVRLSRRVELLSVVVAQADVPMDDVVTTLMPELTDADMQNVRVFPDPSAELPATQEDIPPDIDQMLDAAVAMGSLEQENTIGGSIDDIYLDLDTGDMDMVNFDDLDMEGMF